jgi:SAM-dependent methyltransferase
MEQTITDISSYRKEMAKSMVDKLFFLEKIDVGLIVDFGCADGVMLNYIKDLRPDIQLVGYDISNEMIELANKSEIWYDKEKPLFTSKWNRIQFIVKDCKRKGIETAITLSSVIHEVYSYGDEKSIKEFWDNLFNTGFDYIIIRDMLLSKKSHHDSHLGDVEKIYKSNDPHIEEFESTWGPITDYKNLLHFLLKYRYTKNWFRELRENYLPITLEDMLNKIPTDSYSYDYYDHYVLPFIERSVKKEFKITLKEPTHIKLILKKK